MTGSTGTSRSSPAATGASAPGWPRAWARDQECSAEACAHLDRLGASTEGGGRALAVRCDLSHEEQVESIDAVRAAFDGEYMSHASEAWAYDEMGQARASAGPPADLGRGLVARCPAPRRGEGRRMAARRPARGRHVGGHRAPARAARARRQGSPEQIAGFLRVPAELGVDQIQVAFRSRDVHELYDQLRVFGAEVAPLVGLGAVR